jgi:hypothetical protein
MAGAANSAPVPVDNMAPRHITERTYLAKFLQDGPIRIAAQRHPGLEQRVWATLRGRFRLRVAG